MDATVYGVVGRYWLVLIVFGATLAGMSKRTAETVATGPGTTRRRLSARDVVIASPMRASTGSRVSGSPVLVTIHKWANKAGEIFPTGTPQDVPVWQLQIVHENRPSVTFGFLGAVRGYLPEDELESLDELEQRKGLRIVIAGGQGQDPDSVGVKPWRVAMYSASATPVGALHYLAGFIQHVGSKPEFVGCGVPGLPIAPQSAVHLGGEVPEPWQLAGNTVSPAHAFDGLPPRGRRHLLLTVEKEENSECYSVMVSGNTWQYRTAFDRASVPGGYVGEEGSDREYVRLLRHLLDDDDARARIRDMLDTEVLQGHAVFLVDETETPDDEFVTWVRTLPSVHHR